MIKTSVAALAAAIFVMGALSVCAIFPNKYAAEINAAADEFGLDRALVRAVVWTESGFDRRATSDKGAQGLMQLMPETFRSCAAALRIKDARPFRVRDNLRCGCYYLSILKERFGGDARGALMAYNAGEPNARRFIKGERMFKETANYLKKIAAAQKFYSIFT